MLKPNVQEITEALDEISNIIDKAVRSSVDPHDVYKACEELINRPIYNRFSSALCFYIGVRCLFLDEYYLALIYMLKCVRDKSTVKWHIFCGEYIDFLERNNKSRKLNYNIGILYREGISRNKDVIYARRLQLDDFVANLPLAVELFGDDFFRGRSIRQSDHIAYCLYKIAAENSTKALEGVVLCKALGIGDIGSSGILSDYNLLAKNKQTSAKAFIIRACIGLCGEKDLSAASELAVRQIKEGSNYENFLYNSISNPKFQEFITTNLTAESMINDYGWNVRPSAYALSTDRVDARQLGILSGMLAHLAIYENHAYELEWATTAARFGCSYWNLPYQTVMINSLNIGPKLQSRTKLGIPIGKWPIKARNTDIRPPQNDGFSIHIRGKDIIKITNNVKEHRILYGSKIFNKDDLIVAAILAFGNDKPVYPRFSIESFGNGFIEEQIIPIKNRSYWPSWLGSTEIGHSIYLADQMMPTFGIGCLFSQTDFFHNARFELDRHKSDFFSEIASASGSTPHSMSRNSINSKKVSPLISTSKPWWRFGRQIQTYALTEMQMYFDASYIYYDLEGREHRDGFPNDPQTQLGRRAIIGSERYEELARAFPVFARVRLFLMIAATLAQLAEPKLGYKVSPPLRRKLEKLRSRYEKRSSNRFPIFTSYANLPRLERDE